MNSTSSSLQNSGKVIDTILHMPQLFFVACKNIYSNIQITRKWKSNLNFECKIGSEMGLRSSVYKEITNLPE